MIYSKLSARDSPSDISRKSFHPSDERSPEPREPFPSCPARVFDIIEIPETPGTLQFRSSAFISSMYLSHLFPLCSRFPVLSFIVCLSRLRLTIRPYFAFVSEHRNEKGGEGGKVRREREMEKLGGNLTEAKWDKIAPRGAVGLVFLRFTLQLGSATLNTSLDSSHVNTFRDAPAWDFSKKMSDLTEGKLWVRVSRYAPIT